MNRRALISLIGGAAAWPLAARAQQPAKVPRVGILSPAASETIRTLTAFRERIRELGYVEGQTIALDFRLSKGITDSLPALAAELVRIPVNVIVTESTSGTLAAFAATRTIPIVMGTTGGDPVALGLAKSLSRPGGNVTGTQFLALLSDKRLQLLKQAFPGAQRVAVLVWNNRATIIGIASRARVPAIYPEREYADDGGLIAYGPNAPEHFRLAAGYVDRILRGANPGDLPINVSSKFDFVINLRTARALQLALSPDFVSAANEVIE